MPANKPRLVEGAFNPAHIFELVRLGIDLFDSSYAIVLAENACAFRVAADFPRSAAKFEEVDLSNAKFVKQFAAAQLKNSSPISA